MINWHRPQDKMPEVGNEVVLCGFNTSLRVGVVREEYGYLVVGRSTTPGGWNAPDNIIADYNYWAYAKDFSFPKEDG